MIRQNLPREPHPGPGHGTTQYATGGFSCPRGPAHRDAWRLFASGFYPGGTRAAVKQAFGISPAARQASRSARYPGRRYWFCGECRQMLPTAPRPERCSSWFGDLIDCPPFSTPCPFMRSTHVELCWLTGRWGSRQRPTWESCSAKSAQAGVPGWWEQGEMKVSVCSCMARCNLEVISTL